MKSLYEKLTSGRWIFRTEIPDDETGQTEELPGDGDQVCWTDKNTGEERLGVLFDYCSQVAYISPAGGVGDTGLIYNAKIQYILLAGVPGCEFEKLPKSK